MKLRSALEFVAEYVRPSRVEEITPEEVARGLGSAEMVVIDCNLRERFERGHVPGARHTAWDVLDPAVLPEDRDALLVFYCASAL